MDGPPWRLLTSPIASGLWSPAAGAQFRIGRFLKRLPLKQESDGWRRHEAELGFVEEYGRSRIGRPVVWLRYGRHFGHYQRADTCLRTIFEELGNYGLDRHLGHGCGRHARRVHGRTFRTAR